MAEFSPMVKQATYATAGLGLLSATLLAAILALIFTDPMVVYFDGDGPQVILILTFLLVSSTLGLAVGTVSLIYLNSHRRSS